MTNLDTVIVCANPDCRVGETGKCVEGLTLDKCPRYGHAPASTGVKFGASPQESEGLALPSGDKLTVSDAAEVLRRRACQVIAILGGRDAGKTSLVASLYGLFQDGPVSEFSFAGSSTLTAFEVACHDARAVSQRTEPHVERTPRGQLGIYHLTLHHEASGGLSELLVADRAGEEYLEVADDATACRGFSEILRADVLTLLVDGRRLLDTTARHNLRAELLMMLQALRDGGALHPRQRLAVALTKLDVWQDHPDAGRAAQDFLRLVDSAKSLVSRAVASIKAFRLAALPASDALARGHGVPELLGYWMEPGTPGQVVVSDRPKPMRAVARLAPLIR